MRVDCAQKGIANPRFKASGLQIRWNGCGDIGFDFKTFSIVY